MFRIIGVALALLLAVSGEVSAADVSASRNDEAKIVAVVNGHPLSAATLERKEAGKLLSARYQYYLAERDALDMLIDHYLLESQAGREHVTVDQLLERHAASQLKDPTDDQLRVYYEGLQTDLPFEVVRAKILEHIRHVREAKARAAYLKSLRQQAKITIALAPPTAEVKLGSAPKRGPAGAPVTLVEFADYECPYCRQTEPGLKSLEEEFKGKLLVVFMDYPLPMHRYAEKAAEAARCAGEQGKYWEFHDSLFAKEGLDVAELKQRAKDMHLDSARFDKCLDSGEQAAAVAKDLEQGQALGLTGTPSFFINDHFISGAVGPEALRDMINQQLSQASVAEQSNGGVATASDKQGADAR